MQQGSICADLYLRLSLDREGKTAIERQEADCRTWAARHGLVVRQVHVDRGKSGYRDVARKWARTEAETQGERIRRAKQYLRGRGRWIGGQPPYGLRVDADSGHREPDPGSAVCARLIADEALEGRPLVRIARLLNEYGIA